MIETLVFSYTVTRKKHESSCLLRDRFWCISPEPLELKKSQTILDPLAKISFKNSISELSSMRLKIYSR